MKTEFKPTQSEWLNIAKRIHENYSKNERAWIDKNKLLVVIEAFETLYGARNTQQEDEFYLKNLQPPAKLEGRRQDVIGTVAIRLELTRCLINKPNPFSGMQASRVAQNLLSILSREQFKSDIGELLAPHSDALRDLATGKI